MVKRQDLDNGTWLLFAQTLVLKDLADRVHAPRRRIGTLSLVASRAGQPTPRQGSTRSGNSW